MGDNLIITIASIVILIGSAVVAFMQMHSIATKQYEKYWDNGRGMSMATINHTIRVPLDGTTMTVNIRPVYTREFRLRMWAGIRLLHIVAWVLGCNFQFEQDDEA